MESSAPEENLLKKEEDLELYLQNPWSVANVDAFLYYCCPQCDHRCKSKHLFVDHAFSNHPSSKNEL
jgi:hypothetical protein